jgi:hypothetical protein
MKNPTEFSTTGSFNIAEIAASLPETATTLLVDQYLTNRDAAAPASFEFTNQRRPIITQRATNTFMSSRVGGVSG